MSLKADYNFDESFASSIPGAPDLGVLDPAGIFTTSIVNGVADEVYVFPVGGGVSFDPTDLIARNTYSVVATFEFDATSSFRRILSFNAIASSDDYGFYSNNGALEFYSDDETTGPPGDLLDGVFSNIAFTRAPDTSVAAYGDGALHLTALDPTGEAVISYDGLRFFQDNGPEHSAGSVARIRIYKGVLSASQVTDINVTGGLVAGAKKSGRPKLSGNGKKMKTGLTLSCPDEGVKCPYGSVVELIKRQTMKTTDLGKVHGSLAPGKSKKVKIKLSKKGLAQVSKPGKLDIQVEATITPASGNFSSIANRGRF